jgi:hypothetical protein
MRQRRRLARLSLVADIPADNFISGSEAGKALEETDAVS